MRQHELQRQQLKEGLLPLSESAKLIDSVLIRERERERGRRKDRAAAMMDPASGGDGGGEGGGLSWALSAWSLGISRRYQHLLDKATPYVLRRWVWLAALALAYAIRVLIAQGFYVVTYALGIYVLNLLIGFLSPQVDPEIQALVDDGAGPSLPTRSSDEFRPFVRRLPEFKFWYSITKAFCVAFVLTFFSVFDVPVFWPILLFYWLVLFTVTMKRQILHMIKYKYVPFTFGKQRYTSKKPASSDDAGLSSN